MRTYTFGMYEKAVPNELSFREKLLAAGEAGFDALEVSIDESDQRLARLNWTKQQRAELLAATRETGVYINTMCLSGHRKYPLGSNDPDTVRRGLDIMEKAVELSYDLGVRIIQLAGYDVYYEESTPETHKRFSENLVMAVNMAAARGVILAFETMETPFMNTIEKAMVHVHNVNSPYLQVYPDMGNISNGAADVAADIASGKGHIVAAHLKETVPGVFRDMHFGEGSVNFRLVTDCLKAQGVSLYTAEFWYHDGDDWRAELKRAHDFLRPYLEG